MEFGEFVKIIIAIVVIILILVFVFVIGGKYVNYNLKEIVKYSVP